MADGFKATSFVLVITVFAAAAFATPKTATRASDFVDSIGVNTHFGNAESPVNAYADRRIGVKLAALGVRHIRDHTNNDLGLKLVDDLHRKYGIRATLVLGETTRSPADLVKLLKRHPAYEAIEGLNEPDFTNRTYKAFADDRAKNEYPATRTFQDEMYAALKADPKTKDIPVLSPAMGRSAKSPFLLPILCDVAAMHRYPWEGKTAMEPSFGLDDAIANMAKLRGDRPLWATESGYYNEPAAHPRSAPEGVAGNYTPRLIAEFFNRGVARTYLYELADQGPDKSEREQNFGLLRHDMTEKPAFIALKNLIELLKEPKAKTFTPAPLDFTLAPDDARIHHTLLQKSDGRFYLLLWQEVLSYDAAGRKDIAVAPMDVILTLGAPFDGRVFAPNESIKPTATQRGAKAVKLSVPDVVIVVELTAGA